MGGGESKPDEKGGAGAKPEKDTNSGGLSSFFKTQANPRSSTPPPAIEKEKRSTTNVAIPAGFRTEQLRRDARDTRSERSDDSENEEEAAVPTVFRWKRGGVKVYITGTFNDWSARIPLVRSTHDFTVILPIPIGEHEYKFIVDGEWRCQDDMPIRLDAAGNQNNILNVKPIPRQQRISLEEIMLSSSPPGEYGQVIPALASLEDKEPLAEPPQLSKCVLNTRQAQEPTNVPIPHRAQLNHVYRADDNEVMVATISSRYKNKFTTTVYYDPVPRVRSGLGTPSSSGLGTPSSGGT